MWHFDQNYTIHSNLKFLETLQIVMLGIDKTNRKSYIHFNKNGIDNCIILLANQLNYFEIEPALNKTQLWRSRLYRQFAYSY